MSIATPTPDEAQPEPPNSTPHLHQLIFAFFIRNHAIEGLAFPPLVPVVVANAMCLALQFVLDESYAKLSYAAMQLVFALVFFSQQASLVQEPFPFAKDGSECVSSPLSEAFACLYTHQTSLD